MSSADAVKRETDWLSITNDTLPALTVDAGGPFDIVQGYWPRTPRTMGRGLYVLRDRLREERAANIRRRGSYMFLLRCYWPLTSGAGAAEQEQANLDAAVELVLQRVGGLLQDKTHGDRFLSVAEDPRYVDVVFADPEKAMASAPIAFEAHISYAADDFEING